MHQTRYNVRNHNEGYVLYDHGRPVVRLLTAQEMADYIELNIQHPVSWNVTRN